MRQRGKVYESNLQVHKTLQHRPQHLQQHWSQNLHLIPPRVLLEAQAASIGYKVSLEVSDEASIIYLGEIRLEMAGVWATQTKSCTIWNKRQIKPKCSADIFTKYLGIIDTNLSREVKIRTPSSRPIIIMWVNSNNKSLPLRNANHSESVTKIRAKMMLARATIPAKRTNWSSSHHFEAILQTEQSFLDQEVSMLLDFWFSCGGRYESLQRGNQRPASERARALRFLGEVCTGGKVFQFRHYSAPLDTTSTFCRCHTCISCDFHDTLVLHVILFYTLSVEWERTPPSRECVHKWSRHTNMHVVSFQY